MTFKDWFTQQFDRDIGERVKHATNMRMPEKDRTDMRAFLSEYAKIHPLRNAVTVPTKRTWNVFGFAPMPLIAASLMIVVSGTSVAGAAESALPGDLLYPIKVSVNEEVRAVLAVSPQAKAEVAVTRAERRIAEIEVLSARGEFDETIKTDLDERLDAHVLAAEEYTSTADEDRIDSTRERRLLAVLRAHETLIAENAIGGSLVEETFAMVAPTDEGATGTTIAMDSTPVEDTASIALMVTEAPVETFAARKVAIEETIAPTLVPIEETVTEVVESPKKEVRDVKKDMRTAKRQMDTAKQRIESLKKFIERMKTQASEPAIIDANAGLLAAQETFSQGESLYASETWLDASAMFNIAIRTAIDTRERLSEQYDKEFRTKDAKKTEQRGERSRENDD